MTHYIRIVKYDGTFIIMAFDDVSISEANQMADLTRRLIHGCGFRHASKEEFEDFLSKRNIDLADIDE